MKPRSLRASLSSDWQLKVAAFFLAFIMWALVRVGTPDQRAVTIPVTIGLHDPEWILMDDPVPSTVDVRFSGPPSEVFRLTAMDGVAVTVPITDVTGQEMVVALQPSWIPVDGYRGVVVEDILPSTVHVHLDHLRTASIPVRVTTRGSLSDDLAMIRSISVTPGVVRVSGPASLVEQLDSVDIVPIDLGDVDERGTMTTPVDTAGLGRLTVIPSEVTVRVPVEQSLDRVLAAVPVLVDAGSGQGDPVGDLEVSPATVRLTLRGARTQVSNLDPGRVRVVVPPAELLGMKIEEERKVPIVIEGLPLHMSVEAAVDSVLVRRQTQP